MSFFMGANIHVGKMAVSTGSGGPVRATDATVQPSNFVFSNLGATTMTVGWTAGNGTYTLVAVRGARLVASVQLFTRSIRAPGGTALALGGIGSVATHPEFERRGIATALLHRAGAEMRRRGTALSLLFSDRVAFYERLGWQQVTHPVWVLRWSEPTPDGRAGRVRELRETDLPALRSIYAEFNAGRPGTTLRDESYWRGQLAFAGNPEERVRVIEAGGTPVAYARRIDFAGLDRISEFAARRGHESALALVLRDLARAPDRPLFVPAVPDPAVDRALAVAGSARDVIDFPGQMWRVEDRGRLESLVVGGADLDDAALLRATIAGASALYWPSDRF